MMKKLITLTFISLFATSFAQDATGEVVGTVVLKETGEPLYNARVFIMDFDKRYNSRTDFDGRFRISAVPTGKYKLNVLMNQDTLVAKIVDVPIGGFENVGTIEYTNSVLELPEIYASAEDQGIKLVWGSLPVKSLSSEEIEKSPVKFDVKSLISTMTSDVKLTDDGQLVFRGARKGDMIYLVDGMKVRGDLNVPSSSIGKMMVYSGGLPAKFGDTTGGVVVMESKSYFDLLRDHQRKESMKRMGME